MLLGKLVNIPNICYAKCFNYKKSGNYYGYMNAFLIVIIGVKEVTTADAKYVMLVKTVPI